MGDSVMKGGICTWRQTLITQTYQRFSCQPIFGEHEEISKRITVRFSSQT